MYVYAADVYCDDCGEAIANDLRESGQSDTGDSSDFPQHEADPGESDSPQTCGAHEGCLNAEPCTSCDVGAHGCDLGASLTPAGYAYLYALSTEDPANGCPETRQRWFDAYDIPYDTDLVYQDPETLEVYNGAHNYATWNVGAWFANDPSLYLWVENNKPFSPASARDGVRDLWGDRTPNGADLDQVDWYAVARDFNA
jgi:hypothetical protein